MIIDIAYPASQRLTFVDILTLRAQQQPEQAAYTFLDFGKKTETSLTYGDLDRRVRSLAARLQRSGYAGQTALLLYPSGLDYIIAFLACMYAGVVAVPIYPPHSARSLPRLKAIIDDTQAAVALATAREQADILHRFGHLSELQRLAWLATDDLPVDLDQDWKKPGLTNNDLAFLQYTSGSTAAPKGVMVSHGNLLYNSREIGAQMKLSERDRGVSWLPIFHDLGLIMGILQPLYAGYHTVLMPPTAFLQYPLRWLQALSDYRATVSYAPNFAYELCLRRVGPADRARLDLSHWQIALNGAEPVRYDTLNNFAETFADCGFHADAFMPAYGLAEATLLVSGVKRRSGVVVKHVDRTLLEQHRVADALPDAQSAQTLVGCGTVTPTQRVIVVDPEALTRCQPAEIGELWIAGGSVAQGYFGKQEATKDTFHAWTTDTHEGPFLRSGDLGFLQDGEVFITGRLKDLIIIKGRNHYPQDIEYTVEQSSPIVRPGCVIAFSHEVESEERLVVVAEIRLPQSGLEPGEATQMVDEALKAMRRNIAEAHEITVDQVKLVKVGEIPKTSSGKLQRQTCRMHFLAGSLRDWEETHA